MGKRKADSTGDGSEKRPAAKVAKSSSTKGAAELGVTFTDFQQTAPSLSLKLFKSASKPTKASASSSSPGNDEGEILSLELTKTSMSTGSYGYSASGKRISIELEVDGKKQKVSALVSVNVTVVGSKKVSGADEKSA